MSPIDFNAGYAATSKHGVLPADIGANSWGDVPKIAAWQEAHGLFGDAKFGPQSVAKFRAEHPAPAPTPDAIPIEARGIDVSAWQPKIDWPEVALAGYSFAFVKATQNEGYTSKHLCAQVDGAREAGLAVGLYHFAVPEIGDSPEAEADQMADAHMKFSFDCALRPVLDFEDAHGGKGAASPRLPAQFLVDWAERFVAHVEARLGYAPILYTYASFLIERRKEFLASKLARCPLWLAKYSTTPPKDVRPWAAWAAWQYTSKAVVPGIPGRVDANLAPRGLDELRVPQS